MAKSVQISAEVSQTTKELLERYCRSTGIKKGRLVEQAVLHHLTALHNLPAEVIIPPKLVISRKSGKQIIEAITGKSEPTKALRDLMSGNED